MSGRDTAGAAGAAGAAGVAIVVNGEAHTVAAGDTVAALLAALGTEPRGVAVAVDGEVVPRRAWDAATFCGGEHVEILTIAQGG